MKIQLRYCAILNIRDSWVTTKERTTSIGHHFDLCINVEISTSALTLLEWRMIHLMNRNTKMALYYIYIYMWHTTGDKWYNIVTFLKLQEWNLKYQLLIYWEKSANTNVMEWRTNPNTVEILCYAVEIDTWQTTDDNDIL